MYPEVFHIGSFPVRSYGLMLAISFLAGVWYISILAKRDNKPFEKYLAVAYISIAGGVVGARLAYVLFHLEEFAGDWTASFNPFAEGQYGIAGLNLYGGVILAVLASYLYCRLAKLDVLDTFDYFSPTIGIGLAITRIGCFLNGCCFGTPTGMPWGVNFPEGSIPWYVYGNQHLHPSQLYSSLYGIGLFLLLAWILKKRKFVGQAIGIMFMVESVFRFAIEQVRYYENAMHIDFLGAQPTYNHIMSVALFLLGLGIYMYGRKYLRVESQTASGN